LSGLSVVRRTIVQQAPRVVSGALAMPQGPTLSQNTAFNTVGFAQAADFYDSIGVCHHSDYFHAVTDDTTAVSRLAELGIRHIRHGLWSPADNTSAFVRTAAFVAAVKAHATWSGYFIWGTAAEPQFGANSTNTNDLAYRIGLRTDTNPEDTFLRVLDGVTGPVTTQNWPATSPYYPNKRKYASGTFSDYGWETAAALEGPNEPDLRTNYPTSIRNEVHAQLQAAKNARTTEVVLGGDDYISSATGRITPGPAYAPQLPVSASAITAGNSSTAFFSWASYGDYTLTGEVDVAARHNYWGAMQPSYRGQWEKATSSAISSGRGWPGKGADRYRKQSYNGALTPSGRYGSELPYFQTEEGWLQLETSASANRTPSEVAGEYAIRAFVHNYLGGARRTYYFALTDASGGNGFPSGWCKTDWTRRASFYAVKNLLEIVGFVQGFTPQPINVTTDFTTSTAANNQWGAGGAASEWNWDFDGLRTLVLQRDDCHLIILVRDRILWDQDNKVYTGVSDPKTVTVTVPSGLFTSASRAVPALNSTITPNGLDGQDYSWSLDPGATDGTNFRPWTSGEVGGTFAFNGTSFKTTMAGLTQVFRLTP